VEVSVAVEGLLFASDKKVHQVLTENNNTSPDSWVGVVNVRFIWASDPPVAGKDSVAGIYAWRRTQ
jgi:hypothetical protein